MVTACVRMSLVSSPRGGADPRTAYLSCLVEIAEPGDDTRPWWQVHRAGTGDQIGAALDELAVRMLADPRLARGDELLPSGEVRRCAFRVEVRWPGDLLLARSEGYMRLGTVAVVIRSIASETRSAVARLALTRAIRHADVLLDRRRR